MSASSPRLRLGTRRSPLALWQARWVAERLRRDHWPDLEIELVEIVTEGDKILDRPLAEVGGKGLFVSAIDERLLAGDIDFAVHSMKDLPAHRPDAVAIIATPTRADPRDVLCGPAGLHVGALGAGMRIGTSSPRRAACLRRSDPEAILVSVRGNVGTRLAKIRRGEVDAVVLAGAGIARLALESEICEWIDPATMIPAAGQGILAIECRADDASARERLSVLTDPDTAVVAAVERAFLARLDGGCRVPMGCFARVDAEGVCLVTAMLASADARPYFEVRVEGVAVDAVGLGREAAERLLALGGDALVRSAGV